MKKTELAKTIISILVIVVLAVFIVNINKVFSPTAGIKNEEQITRAADVKSEGLPSDTSVIDESTCFGKYGQSQNTVVFVHSNYCPHCKNMVPIIEELEGEGYKFYWAESSGSEAGEVISNCFGDLLSGYVPQFICPKTGKEQTGEMSKLELKDFANACR